MDQKQRAVNPKRRYDTTGRRAGAARSRERIIDAAERRFLQDGYIPTTIAMIASDAGVSADTVYKTFAGKAGLVRAIRTRALAGEGPIPAEQRSDALHTRGLDAHEIIEAWGAFTAEVAPRAAPIMLLLRDAAAADPQVRKFLAELDDDRHGRMTRNAKRLRDAGHLRTGVTLAQAADILWTYSSQELYELLVLRRGWSLKRYGRFVAEAMIAALL